MTHPDGGYMVALSQSIVNASEAELAHEYEPGTIVLYRPDNSPACEATVTGLDMGQW